MKNLAVLLFFGLWFFQADAQTEDFTRQPYLETLAEVDTAVVPDNIYLFIQLNERDKKDRISTEELEARMLKVLDSLHIDAAKNLTVLDYTSSYKKFFLSGTKIIKSKMYSLLVHDAQTVEKLMSGLERAGISNVAIDRVEYSKADQLLLELKAQAVAKAKRIADKMVEPLQQKVGKAIYITDVYYGRESIEQALSGRVAGARMGLRGIISPSIYGQRAESEEVVLDIKKIKFKATVKVIFVLE